MAASLGFFVYGSAQDGTKESQLSLPYIYFTFLLPFLTFIK